MRAAIGHREKDRRLGAANRVLDAIAPHVRLSRLGGRVFASWRQTQFGGRPGKAVRKAWTFNGGGQYARWRDFPSGGTCEVATGQLVRWVKGWPVLPLRSWRHWCSPVVGMEREALAVLKEAGWPEEVPCVCCGRTLGPVGGLDWWSRDGVSGPCCDWTACGRSKRA